MLSILYFNICNLEKWKWVQIIFFKGWAQMYSDFSLQKANFCFWKQKNIVMVSWLCRSRAKVFFFLLNHLNQEGGKALCTTDLTIAFFFGIISSCGLLLLWLNTEPVWCLLPVGMAYKYRGSLLPASWSPWHGLVCIAILPSGWKEPSETVTKMVFLS